VIDWLLIVLSHANFLKILTVKNLKIDWPGWAATQNDRYDWSLETGTTDGQFRHLDRRPAGCSLPNNNGVWYESIAPRYRMSDSWSRATSFSHWAVKYTVLGKPLTHTCMPVTKQNNLVLVTEGQWCSEGNRRSGFAMAIRHRLLRGLLPHAGSNA